MINLDPDRQRREFSRWILLISLNNAEPDGIWEEVLISILQGMYADATKLEMRRGLVYLEERGLVHVRRDPGGRWFSKLTRTGIDVVEYSVDVEPGIARPEKLG